MVLTSWRNKLSKNVASHALKADPLNSYRLMAYKQFNEFSNYNELNNSNTYFLIFITVCITSLFANPVTFVDLNA